MPETTKDPIPAGSPGAAGSVEDRMPEDKLLNQIIHTLRMNMSLGRMTTENDEQFKLWIEAWADGRSAYGIAPPNATGSATEGRP